MERARPRPDVVLRPVEDGDVAALEALFARVVAAGEGFPHAPPLSHDDFEATWRRPGCAVIVAVSHGAVAGAYYLRANFPGRAAHIANAGYMVDAAWRGRGIGRLLVEDSVTRAPSLGFDAIQFNLVFASNPARRLYEELGWPEVGRVPDAVGGEDAVIYWRAVGERGAR